jgi:NAD(P)-dependent dehydrogenase (short-subunit alcohol dehydrogenase family)
MRLEGKVAIVTGGAQGIGEAYSVGMAREGAKVVIADVQQNIGEELVKKIKKDGGSALFIKTDIASKADVEAMVQKTNDIYNHLDIIVNNAAISENVSIEETTEEIWDKLFAVNVKGVFFCSQAAAAIMKKQQSGSIINISSIAAICASKGICAYAATKGAVLTMTKVFAIELCPYNIKVNAILPGVTDTYQAKKRAMEDPSWAKQVVKEIPMGRMAQKEELVGAVLYFASDDSTYCTGQTLIVDGGVSML